MDCQTSEYYLSRRADERAKEKPEAILNIAEVIENRAVLIKSKYCYQFDIPKNFQDPADADGGGW